jgi:hypothetical protein
MECVRGVVDWDCPHARGGPAGLAYLLQLVRYSGHARDSVLDAVPAAGDLCAKQYCNLMANGYAVSAADSLSAVSGLSAAGPSTQFSSLPSELLFTNH